MRGGDPDAALYWLARMLEAGEDPRFIARRLVIQSAEDVGNADPMALVVATAGGARGGVRRACPRRRFRWRKRRCTWRPRRRAMLPTPPWLRAQEDVRTRHVPLVPKHLRDANYPGAKKFGHGEGYVYPHDFRGTTRRRNTCPRARSRGATTSPPTWAMRSASRERMAEWERRRPKRRRVEAKSRHGRRGVGTARQRGRSEYGMGRRVAVAMSGGVDSSVAAALLLEQGYEVVGLTMQLWPEDAPEEACPARPGAAGWRPWRTRGRVAQALGIRHYVVDMREAFQRLVIEPFCESYVRGRTPNPALLLQHLPEVRRAAAQGRGDRGHPPGHRALRPGRIRRVTEGAWVLRRGVDDDQGPVLRPLRSEPGASLEGALPAGRADQGRDPAAGGRTGFAGSGEGGEPGDLLRLEGTMGNTSRTGVPGAVAARADRGPCRPAGGPAPRDHPLHRRTASGACGSPIPALCTSRN